MFGSKSCHIRVAIDTAAEITLFRPTFSSACADTTFDEWTYARVFIHIHFLERFPNQCVWVNTLSLSRVDTVIYRSGLPHDASHLPSYSYKFTSLNYKVRAHMHTASCDIKIIKMHASSKKLQLTLLCSVTIAV